MLRRGAVAALVAVLTVGLAAAPARADVSMIKLVQEEGGFEARFPDILRLDDGRMMVVYHKALDHQTNPGTIQLMISKPGGGWDGPDLAFADPAWLAGKDTRDPKLGRMTDGSVVMSFFVKGDGVWYAVWKPGWTRFTEPERLNTGLSGTTATHGAPLALAGGNQVLVPFYNGGTTGGAWYAKATWQPNTLPRLDVDPGSVTRIIQNDNPTGRIYTEPSFVQAGDGTVVGAIRAEQDAPAGEQGPAVPAVIARWNPGVTGRPDFHFQLYTDPANTTPVLASSHHLLKLANGQVLFTYGDRGQADRPTVGRLITSPTADWPLTAKTVPLYNSGNPDQANPSSVQIDATTFWTLGYNAKTKAESPSGGTLWIIQSRLADYS